MGQQRGRMRFRAATSGDIRGRAIIAVDLGYRRNGGRSTGVALPGNKLATRCSFGDAVVSVLEFLQGQGARRRTPVLVIEAPLSQHHDSTGNPENRGAFENGRGWYCGSGAPVALAALRLLEMLDKGCDIAIGPIPLAEAFLSNKTVGTDDAVDALSISTRFRNLKDESLAKEAEPLSDLVEGVPPVRVVTAKGRRG